MTARDYQQWGQWISENPRPNTVIVDSSFVLTLLATPGRKVKACRKFVRAMTRDGAIVYMTEWTVNEVFHVIHARCGANRDEFKAVTDATRRLLSTFKTFTVNADQVGAVRTAAVGLLVNHTPVIGITDAYILASGRTEKAHFVGSDRGWHNITDVNVWVTPTPRL